MSFYLNLISCTVLYNIGSSPIILFISFVKFPIQLCNKINYLLLIFDFSYYSLKNLIILMFEYCFILKIVFFFSK